MTYAIVVSSKAARDLELAVSYLSDTLKSTEAAGALLDAYDSMLETLRRFPLSNPLVHDDLLAFAGYHLAHFGSYIALYVIDETNRVVSVHRIAHESRNWMQLLV